jgi:hypothetical protein
VGVEPFQEQDCSVISEIDKYNLLRQCIISLFKTEEVFLPVTVQGPGAWSLAREVTQQHEHAWALMWAHPSTVEDVEALRSWARATVVLESPRALLVDLDGLVDEPVLLRGVENLLGACERLRNPQAPAFVLTTTTPANAVLAEFTTVLTLPEATPAAVENDARWEQARGTVASLLRAVVRRDRSVLHRGLGTFSEPELQLLQVWCVEALTEQWIQFKEDSVVELSIGKQRKMFAYQLLMTMDSQSKPELYGRAVLTDLLENS